MRGSVGKEFVGLEGEDLGRLEGSGEDPLALSTAGFEFAGVFVVRDAGGSQFGERRIHIRRTRLLRLLRLLRGLLRGGLGGRRGLLIVHVRGEGLGRVGLGGLSRRWRGMGWWCLRGMGCWWWLRGMGWWWCIVGGRGMVGRGREGRGVELGFESALLLFQASVERVVLVLATLSVGADGGQNSIHFVCVHHRKGFRGRADRRRNNGNVGVLSGCRTRGGGRGGGGGGGGKKVAPQSGRGGEKVALFSVSSLLGLGKEGRIRKEKTRVLRLLGWQ